MRIKRVTGKECTDGRALWEEVFWEDSREFTDYYFEKKAQNNIGYFLGKKPYDAMMFRTPYLMQMGESVREISYLVGVATRKESRHKGYMTALLKHSMEDMYRQKQPFTFLMPANPAIYEPFDFQYIYDKEVWKLKEEETWISKLENLTKEKEEYQEYGSKNALRAACYQEEKQEYKKESSKNFSCPEKNAFGKKCGLYSAASLVREYRDDSLWEELAKLAGEYLNKHYDIYVVRDGAYYKRQLEELKAQKGDIFVWYEEGEVTAYFFYAREEGEVFLQEVVEKESGTLDFLEKTGEKKPAIMARIIHAGEMLKYIVSKEPKTVLLWLEDELIEQNEGLYRLEITSKGSMVTKLEEKRTPEVICHVKELAGKVLQKVFINEIV